MTKKAAVVERFDKAVEACHRAHDTSIVCHRQLKEVLEEGEEKRPDEEETRLIQATAVEAVLEDEAKSDPSLHETQKLRILGAHPEAI